MVGNHLIITEVALVITILIIVALTNAPYITLSSHELLGLSKVIKLGNQYYIKRILFTYNFDNYTASKGKLPKGWLVAWSGLEYGISSKYYHSPPNSLMVEGEYGWSCVLYRPFNSKARFIGIDAWLLLTPPKIRDCLVKRTLSAPIALFCKKCATWGLYLNFIQFGLNDKKIYVPWGGPKNYTVVGSFEFYKWIHILFIIDRVKGVYDLWVNNELVATKVPIPTRVKDRIYELNSVSFSSGWCEPKYYLDDIKVFELKPVTTLTTNQLITTSVITKVSTTTVVKPVTTTVTKTNVVTTTKGYTQRVVTMLTLTRTQYLTKPVVTTVTKLVTMYLSTYTTITKTITKYVSNLRSNLPSMQSVIVSAIIVLIGIILFIASRRS